MNIKIPLNQTYKKQNAKLTPATFKKGVVTAVYPSSYTVDVYFVGNNQSTIRNIAVATNVDINAVSPGDKCKVDLFTESNPSDMVMSYTYGKPQISTFSSGITSVSHLGSTIAHGLGSTPNVVIITPNASGDVYQTSAADSTNIYLTYSSGSGSLSTNWYALIV